MKVYVISVKSSAIMSEKEPEKFGLTGGGTMASLMTRIKHSVQLH